MSAVLTAFATMARHVCNGATDRENAEMHDWLCDLMATAKREWELTGRRLDDAVVRADEAERHAASLDHRLGVAETERDACMRGDCGGDTRYAVPPLSLIGENAALRTRAENAERELARVTAERDADCALCQQARVARDCLRVLRDAVTARRAFVNQERVAWSSAADARLEMLDDALDRAVTLLKGTT